MIVTHSPTPSVCGTAKMIVADRLNVQRMWEARGGSGRTKVLGYAVPSERLIVVRWWHGEPDWTVVQHEVGHLMGWNHGDGR